MATGLGFICRTGGIPGTHSWGLSRRMLMVGHPSPATKASRESLSPACLKLQRSGKNQHPYHYQASEIFPPPPPQGQRPQSSPTTYLLIRAPFASPAMSQSQYPSYNTFPPTPTALLFFPVTPNQLFVRGTKRWEVSAAGFSLHRFHIQLFGNAWSKQASCDL